MERARKIWEAEQDKTSATNLVEPKFVVVDNIQEELGAARASKNKEISLIATLRAQEKVLPVVRNLTSATASDVDVWLCELKQRRPFCNAEQFEAIAVVTTRVKQELLLILGTTVS